LFFLERKNQRTFDLSPGASAGEHLQPHGRVVAIARPLMPPGNDQSLFASFSSEKEESFNRSSPVQPARE
jgi:hypothetical protein